jgi:exosome complex component RRP4
MLQVKSVLPMPLFHSAEASTSYAKTRHHPDVQEDVDMEEAENAQYNYGELDPEESGRLERHITTPGEVVTSAKEFMRGHGTLLDESGENVVATVAGTVERVNKLVSVKSIKSR